MISKQGSGDFQKKIRGIASTLGMKLNEDGLYDKKTNKLVDNVNSVEDVFKKLGMEMTKVENWK